MKKMFKTLFLVVLFVVFFGYIPKVDAALVAVPRTGSFSCTYKINYFDESDKVNRAVTVELSGNSDEMYVVRDNWIKENICVVDGYRSPFCTDLAELINNSTHDYSGKTEASVQDAKLGVVDFVSTKKGTPNWDCPNITYDVSIKSVEGVVQYYVKLGNTAAAYKNTAIPVKNNCVLGTAGDIKNVYTCSYSIQGSNFTGVLSENKMRFYIDTIESSRDLVYTDAGCPVTDDLTLCMSETSHDFFVLYKDNNCGTGFTPFNATDVTDPEKDNTSNNDGEKVPVVDPGFSGDMNGDGVDDTCVGILTPKLIDIINEIVFYVRIAVPILLIILGSIDFAKVVLSDDKEQLKKSSTIFIKRCVIAIAIFFIPTVLSFLINIFNSVSNQSITDLINCGIK